MRRILAVLALVVFSLFSLAAKADCPSDCVEACSAGPAEEYVRCLHACLAGCTPDPAPPVPAPTPVPGSNN